MGNITGFVLAGHSYGGFICGMYASKYYHHVKKLMMFSAAGVSKRPENFDAQAYI